MSRSVLVAALLCATSAAHAQAPAPPTPAPVPAPAPASDEQKRAQAKALYEQGLSAYNLGNFDAAIAAFSEAYAISQAPGLLFNIAQSHRLKKDYEKATYFYTTYLRLKPDAANRADVEARLEEMQKLIEDQKKMEALPPSGTVTPDGNSAQPTKLPEIGPVDRPVDPGDAKRAKTLSTAGLATAGAGGALVITGFIFGSLAKSAESDLNALSTNMGTWTPEQQDRYDAGKRNNTIAIVSFVVGGAAIVTGGTLYVLGKMKKSSATVAVNPARGGTTVAVGWSF